MCTYCISYSNLIYLVMKPEEKLHCKVQVCVVLQSKSTLVHRETPLLQTKGVTELYHKGPNCCLLTQCIPAVEALRGRQGARVLKSETSASWSRLVSPFLEGSHARRHPNHVMENTCRAYARSSRIVRLSFWGMAEVAHG